jgi:gas vesicle protein
MSLWFQNRDQKFDIQNQRIAELEATIQTQNDINRSQKEEIKTLTDQIDHLQILEEEVTTNCKQQQNELREQIQNLQMSVNDRISQLQNEIDTLSKSFEAHHSKLKSDKSRIQKLLLFSQSLSSSPSSSSSPPPGGSGGGGGSIDRNSSSSSSSQSGSNGGDESAIQSQMSVSFHNYFISTLENRIKSLLFVFILLFLLQIFYSLFLSSRWVRNIL